MNKQHRHYAAIVGWAEGKEIEFFDPSIGWLSCVNKPEWREDAKYRVKPERTFPETSLTDFSLREIENNLLSVDGNTMEDARKAIANAAIKQYILDSEQFQACEANK